jgi:4-pyridoxate dehydrogenase
VTRGILKAELSLDSFDYIIVGAGAAGCVLANRLSERGTYRVALLEAGGSDTNPLIRIPLGVSKVWNSPKYNWSFFSEPEPFADNRKMFHPRGKVLGGSSSINMMSYVRGHEKDFDRWRDMGLEDWSFANILPYFKRCENWEKGGETRGTAGPLLISENVSPDPVYEAFLKAGVELGYPLPVDYNGLTQDGFARMQQMARNGRRSSAARAYLAPARTRPNLVVFTNALVTRVLVKHGRASGIDFIHNGTKKTLEATREIVLSGGAFCSPKLLLLSGIGPEEHLRSVGIQPVLNLPSVGTNLRDHPQVNVIYGRKGESRLQYHLRIDRLTVSMIQAELFGSGFAAEALGGVTAFVKSGPTEEIPDLELFCVPGSLGAHPWFPVIRPPAADHVTFKATLLRPKSHGHVRLSSSDPDAAPRIKMNYLAEEDDRRVMRRGVEMCHAVAATHAFKDLVGEAITPTLDIASDQDMDAYLAQKIETIFHPCGTCRMGVDDESVVDHQLRVRGIDGLRVVDASVMPDHIGATINGVVMAIAERASDLIRGVVAD